jgi:hypothetical protein
MTTWSKDLLEYHPEHITQACTSIAIYHQALHHSIQFASSIEVAQTLFTAEVPQILEKIMRCW